MPPEQLKQSHPFTALFTANDNIAMGAIRSLYETRRQVLDDISVIGFDNDPAGEFLIPSLSMVTLPVEAMDQAGIEQALQLVNDGKISPVDLFSEDLIVRESVDQLKKPL